MLLCPRVQTLPAKNDRDEGQPRQVMNSWTSSPASSTSFLSATLPGQQQQQQQNRSSRDMGSPCAAPTTAAVSAAVSIRSREVRYEPKCHPSVTWRGRERCRAQAEGLGERCTSIRQEAGSIDYDPVLLLFVSTLRKPGGTMGQLTHHSSITGHFRAALSPMNGPSRTVLAG